MNRALALSLAAGCMGAFAPSAFGADVVTANVPLTMSDGVRLVAEQHVPDRGCPCSVIVNFNPYSTGIASRAGGGVFTLAPEARDYFVAHGYAVLIVDVRGTGQSEGVFGMFNGREQQDYEEVVRQAAEKPFSDGRVAVVGDSYGGIAALLAAERPGIGAPDGGPLQSIVASVPMGDSYRDIGFSGGAPNDGFLTLWGGGLVGAQSTAAPLLSAQSDPNIALNAESSRIATTTEMTQAFVGFNAGDAGNEGDPEPLSGASSFDGPWYRLRSPLERIDRIDVPTFIVGTSQDIFQRAEPVVYNALRLPGAEKKLYLDNQYHGTVGADSSSQDGSTKVYDDHGRLVPNAPTAMTGDWLDHWVRDLPTDVEAWPQVLRRYQTPAGPGTGTFVRERQDPPSALRYRRWYLDGAGTLRGARPSTAGSAQTVFDPLTGVCSHNTIQYLFGVVPDNECSQDSSVNEADGLTFTSPPLAHAAAITGTETLRVFFSSDRPDTNIAAFLSAVAPDGSARQFTFGTLVASLRKLDPTRCAPGQPVANCSVYARNGDIVQPWHPYTRASESKLVPGQVYEALVEIYPPAIALPTGYRLRLTLKTGTFPQAIPTATVDADAIGGTTTFLFGAGHPSYVDVGSVTGGLPTLRREYDRTAHAKAGA